MDRTLAEQLYRKYFDCVYSICFLYMKNEADACDAVHDTFLKMMTGRFHYESDEKSKAWLIVTASNICKSKLGHWWRRNISIDDAAGTGRTAGTGRAAGRGTAAGSGDIGQSTGDYELQEDGSLMMRMIEELPENYRLPVYLHYFEGYTIEEISQMTGVNASTLRSRLARAREILKKEWNNNT